VARGLLIAKDRISSNLRSFGNSGVGDSGVDDKFDGAPVGGRAGSSPDSGSKPGSSFDGTASDVGRAGSSVSLAFGFGDGDFDGVFSALATARAAVRTSEMIACRFSASERVICGTLPDFSADRKTRIL
jgi:hypothetical protein